MELVEDYCEYASGKNMDRPEFLRMLEDAALGRFDHLVVYKLDRLSRNLGDILRCMAYLDDLGVTFSSVTEPLDTTTPLGRMFLQILGSFAEFERETIIERVVRGIEAKVASGKPNGQVGYGLRKDADGVLVALGAETRKDPSGEGSFDVADGMRFAHRRTRWS